MIIASILVACSQDNKINNERNIVDTTNTKKQTYIPNRKIFKNIPELITDSSGNTWVKRTDSSFSLALHFQGKDTLAFSYSPECWLIFPYTVDRDRLVIYWDANIDTKYQYDLVKAVNKIDKKYIGKPFMILELLNDTTLAATYPLNTVKKSINKSSKKKNIFSRQILLNKKNVKCMTSEKGLASYYFQ